MCLQGRACGLKHVPPLLLCHCLANLDAMNVVNDIAEHVLKLTDDFHQCARSENYFQNILQVVKNVTLQIFAKATNSESKLLTWYIVVVLVNVIPIL